MTERPAKPATKRVSAPRPKKRPTKLDHGEISERAYYIHLEAEGCDELTNWLRAERELLSAA